MRTYLALLLWAAATLGVDGMVFFQGSGGVVGKEMDQHKSKHGVPLRRAKRGWMWNQFFLQEEYTGSENLYIGKLHSDMDKEDETVRYVLNGEGAGTIFIINEQTGDLHVTRSLDRESKASYILRAQAVNRKTGYPLEPETEFIVKVHDINDNEPKFPQEVYYATVPERSNAGTSVTQVIAEDADDSMFGMAARLAYSISQGHPYFSVEPATGIIRTALGPSDMDREQREHYQVVIEAKDMGGSRGGLTGSTIVNITLTDVNDNPPRFLTSDFSFSTPETTEMGTPIGRVKAFDRDIGVNAEMDFSIIGGDGQDMFDITTDRITQEGVLSVKKPLDFERKKSYDLKIQVQNPRPLVDLQMQAVSKATVRISVEDVDEPPVFERFTYIMEMKENTAAGSTVGSVSAMDPDIRHDPVRYSIDRHTDPDRVFNVHGGNGSIYLLKSLDREKAAWHNISVVATEFNNREQKSSVPVFIRVLDVNDNAPTLASFYETFVCENAKSGQKIQTITAVDEDDPAGGHRFFFKLAPESLEFRPNFTLKDNQDSTASIFTRRTGYRRLQQSSFHLAVVISDGDYPMQSSTSTLTVRVCTCDRDGNMEMCNAEAQSGVAGLSTGALVAILLCVIILLLIVVLFAALKRQKKKEPLIISKEDVRDNVVSYNDEGGGEEDTQAFDIGALRHPETMEEAAKQRRDIMPSETLFAPPPLLRRSVAAPGGMPPSRDNADVRDFINQRVLENDLNPTAPPYDSLATYAYEGNGSVAESLSSLGSASTEDPGEQDYNYLSEWGPRFRKLADMYGGEDSDRDS
ncbi:hypothetical protein AALO_G00007520 [Alosa alosa]|uniref:Cadherin domain-containing protein n=1 Tax=Alosa alosa TaxID=278164 RepID=A0AAV6HEJ5_9TELE|nr:cadherin-6 [Alosa alosa]XP_048115276.1 cadherin-6 [Alosa alosa]KAG5285795.1 hypothetical protein AALO_G00007520 [Alosa alosa]